MAIQPATEQEASDLREVLAALGPGHFTADLIYRQHVAAVGRHGREPMHPVRLGQVLRDFGAISKAKWDPTKKRERPKRDGYMVKGWVI